jgi:hypothetical protein
MTKKNTLLSIKCLLLFCFIQTSKAQLYTNGGISTGLTAMNGTVAPASYSWSEVPANTGNTSEANANLGFSGFFNTAATISFRLADDFNVPVGTIWNVTDFSFYCYQTGYLGVVSPIDVLRIQIFNGDPAAGGTLIAGDMITNVYDVANSAEALVYRTSNTLVPAPIAVGTTRKIWKVRGNIAASLPSGNYWVVYQVHATNDGSIYFPPVTIFGTRGAITANAKQLAVTTSNWGPVLDTGNPASAPDVVQGMPFLINENTLSINENNLQSSISFYPNPIKNIISISNASGSAIQGVEINDLNGRLVKRVLSLIDSQIDVNYLTTGVYMMKIILDNGITIRSKF